MADFESDNVIIDARKRLWAFLCEFVRPGLAPECVLYGNQRQMTLPPEAEDYAIYYLQDHQRRGTDIEIYDPDNETLTLTEGANVAARIDLYSRDIDTARARAFNLDAVWRSSLSCDFFKGSGLMPLYCDGANDTTITNESSTYLYRWTVNLIMAVTFKYAYEVQGFDKPPDLFLNNINKYHDESGGGTLNIADIDVKIKER